MEHSNLWKKEARTKLTDQSKDRDYFLVEAQDLINGQRAEDYGDAKLNHQKIAGLWSVYLSCKEDNPQTTQLSAQDVVLMMMLVKVARLTHASTADSWVDLCGYAALGGEFNE